MKIILMLRKFRFSLLGLLIFTTIVAVAIKIWLMPFEDEIKGEELSQYKIGRDYLIVQSTQRPNMELGCKTARVKLSRKPLGGYRVHSPVVCRYEDLFLYKNEKSNEYEMPLQTLATSIPLTLRDPIYDNDLKIRIESIVTEIDNENQAIEPYHFVCSDNKVRYCYVWPGHLNGAHPTYLLDEKSIDPNTGKKIEPSPEVKKAIAYELQRSDNQESKK